MPITDFIGAYTPAQAVGYPGMIAESQTIQDVASKVVTTGPIAFGLAVGAGATDGSCRLGGTGFEGIAIADKTRPADLFAVGEVAGLLRKGTVWVTASTVVTAGAAVTFTPATGVIGAALAGAIPNSKFETSGGIGALVRVYLG